VTHVTDSGRADSRVRITALRVSLHATNWIQVSEFAKGLPNGAVKKV
jgi:hypothetical protein